MRLEKILLSANEPPEEAKALARKLMSKPTDMTEENWSLEPDPVALKESIASMNGAQLVSRIEKDADGTEMMQKLAKLKSTFREVDRPTVKTALQTCNKSNEVTASASSRFLLPVQQHGTGSEACIQISGTFPVTSTFSPTQTSGTLTKAENATVISVALLSGCSPDKLAENFIRTNEMPTTLNGSYTLVPSASDFSLFSSAYVTMQRTFFKAGVQCVTLISDHGRSSFQSALHGGKPPTFKVLIAENGSTLELHEPEGNPPVLLIVPANHQSHIVWQVSLSPCYSLVARLGASASLSVQ
eukprot:6564741-Prymnesium_polylepis.1